MTNYDKMTDAELDCLVAEKVMGWCEGYAYEGVKAWCKKSGAMRTCLIPISEWCPSADWNKAMKVRDEIVENHPKIMQLFAGELDRIVLGRAILYFKPRDVVIAALKTVGDGIMRQVIKETTYGKMHSLKTEHSCWQAVRDGRKTFEYRRNDRNYKIGDTLLLMDYCPETESTGGEIHAEVMYILYGGQFGIPKDYCIMQIRIISK